MTVTFTTLSAEVNPTAEEVTALQPILQKIKAAGAGDRFPMEIVLHVRVENMEQVKEIVSDLDRGGFISNYKAQGLVGEVETFRRTAFK